MLIVRILDFRQGYKTLKAKWFIGVVYTILSSTIVSAQTSLKATKDSCLVEATITDINNKPIILADLIITTKPQGDIIKTKTNRKGVAYFLIPKKGRLTYEFKIDYRGDKHVFDRKFKIPQDEGEYDLTAVLRYEPKHVVLAEAQFETNRSMLLPTSHRELQDVVLMMNQKPSMQIEVLGHTDSIGDIQKNIQLSIDRANAVKDFLVKEGISSDRIKTSGHGPKIPIGDNATPEGRQMNRRIEVKIVSQQP